MLRRRESRTPVPKTQLRTFGSALKTDKGEWRRTIIIGKTLNSEADVEEEDEDE